MAGFGEKAKKFMGWYTPEDEDDVFLEDADQDYEEPVPMEPVVSPLRPTRTVERYREEPVSDLSALSRIVTIHPDSYSDALSIGEAFRDGTPVIINLSDMSDDDARRVVDFAAGLVFGLHGMIERVTTRVFLLSPSTVEVAGDTKPSRRASLFQD